MDIADKIKNIDVSHIDISPQELVSCLESMHPEIINHVRMLIVIAKQAEMIRDLQEVSDG